MEANSRVNHPVNTALVQLENDEQIDMGIETTKGCVSTLTGKVIQIGLQYTVGARNCRPIPGKRQWHQSH